MLVSFYINRKINKVNISKPLDISLPLGLDSSNPSAWYIENPTIRPVELDGWVGSVEKGASVNFNNIAFNPHAHGTHTECVGHISETVHSVHKTLKNYFFMAELISVAPENKGEDQIISAKQIQQLLQGKKPQAIVIRTLPNEASKKTRNYNHTNWPYLEAAAALFLRQIGVEHLLIDLPSVDKEKDNGTLWAHKAFWDYPHNPRLEATITEFIYVNNKIKDGSYVLELQTANFVNDATPSRPVLYKIIS